MAGCHTGLRRSLVWVAQAALAANMVGSSGSSRGPQRRPRELLVLALAAVAARRQASAQVMPVSTAYATNFSVIDSSMWATDIGCFSCKAPKDPETVFECTNNTAGALRPASIANGTGLTIVTTRQYNAGYGCKPFAAGGTSGHLSSKKPLHFGTIRVKSKYFPGTAEQVSSAKGFVGLEDPHPGAGAITITMHGVGGAASGAPARANWSHYMQSSVYQHGQGHEKAFNDLGADVNAAENFNVYEIDWSSTAVSISVNGNVVRRVSGTASIPQKPLYVRLHARSTEYNSMMEGSSFESFIEEFSFTPAAAAAAAAPPL